MQGIFLSNVVSNSFSANIFCLGLHSLLTMTQFNDIQLRQNWYCGMKKTDYMVQSKQASKYTDWKTDTQNEQTNIS